MSVNRYYYSNNSSSEVEKDDDFEIIPYSSSSVGSTGSIPWANLDDAIRQNQLEWERIERMLNGEEELPNELELRNEIQEWRRKFFEKKPSSTRQRTSFDSSSVLNPDLSLEIDSISNLSLDSNENDGFVTPTPSAQSNFYTIKPPRTPSAQRIHPILNQTNSIELNLRVNSVPIALQQRQRLTKSKAIGASMKGNSKDSNISMESSTHGEIQPKKAFAKYTLNKVPVNSASGGQVNSASLSQLRMPPILNIDGSRRFRTQGKDNHQSFVQLTRVQQPKSAAIVNLMSQRNYLKNNYNNTTWNNVPVTATANGYVYNKNGIILPAINSKHILERTSGDSFSTNNNNRTSFLPSRRNYIGSSASTATQSSTIRSISAAVRNPRLETKSYYVPFNSRMINKC